MKLAALFSAALLGLSGTCHAIDMPQSAKEMGCQSCHAIDHPVVGPAWLDVAKRYRNKRGNPATFNQLVTKVSMGGEGNWGDMPMAPTDPLGKQRGKIEDLVKFVLSLPDQTGK